MNLNFHEEVLKLADLPLSEDIDNGFFTSDISLMYEDLNKNLNKLNKSQKEISFNVEEICEYVQELKEADDKKLNEDDLINKLISIVDIIEDFYIFALENDHKPQKQIQKSNLSSINIMSKIMIFIKGGVGSPPLEKDDQVITPHAEMLWNSCLKKISLCGLSRIYDEKTDFDVAYNTIVGIDEDITIPVGFIIKTIKSGYIYNGKVIRKSSVIVNKLSKE